jgi:hypothetical protein
MNYELLVFIVLANLAVTLSLWRRTASKANKPPGLNKKAAKELWHSEPITPKHEPPTVAGGEFASLAHDHDRRFFADFRDFCDVVNWWLADEYVGSRWRLQDLPDGDLRLHSDGPILGRSFALFYNQMRLGELKVHPAFEYSTEAPQVHTNIEIRWVRLLSLNAITDLLDCIASHVADPKPNSAEYAAARQAIHFALTKALWATQEITEFEDLDGQDWGELELSLHGSAEWYIARRQGWRKTAAEDAAKAVVKRATATNRPT